MCLREYVRSSHRARRAAAGALIALISSMGVTEGAAAARATTTTVSIRFAAQVNGRSVACAETYQQVGRTKAALFLQDFRIYVSAVRLIDKDGREVPVTLTPDDAWQNDAVALLDFENGRGNCNGNAATNDRITGTVPPGDYRGVVFEIGVPFAMNHQDPTLAPAPLNFTALTWPWSIGYKFTTIDFDTQPAGARKMLPIPDSTETMSATGFSVHLGSTDCVSSGFRVPPKAPCANPNRPTYRFDQFDVQRQVLVMDLGALLAGTDITTNAPESASGCMSFTDDDDCVDIMNRFGLPFRGHASAGQQFIRVVTP